MKNNCALKSIFNSAFGQSWGPLAIGIPIILKKLFAEPVAFSSTKYQPVGIWVSITSLSLSSNLSYICIVKGGAIKAHLKY